MRYDWKLENRPSHCVCGAMFSPDHVMIWKHGGLTFIHHYDLQNITAEWLSKVCYNVAIEPPLQHLLGKVLSHGLQTERMRVGLIFMLGDSGGSDKIPLLM